MVRPFTFANGGAVAGGWPLHLGGGSVGMICVKLNLVLWMLHFGSSWAMAALLWVVQLGLYPHCAKVPRERFVDFHRNYQRVMTWVVGVLGGLELGTAFWLWQRSAFTGMAATIFIASLVLLGLCWLSTALVQVPLHRRLARGYDPAAGSWLVRSNWLRTAGWSLRAMLVSFAILLAT